jgi:hypothetical protein
MARIPDPLFAALKERIPADFEAVRVHAIRKDDITFLVVGKNDEAVLVRFELPSTTTITFLGPLAGGYVRRDDHGRRRIQDRRRRLFSRAG